MKTLSKNGKIVLIRDSKEQIMTIDFRAEVDKRKDDLMEDLFGLLRINSERDDSKVDEQHPFGPGPVKALEHFLALAKRDGYKTRNIDNYAGDFEFGHGDEVLGIFAHLDVFQLGVVGIQTLMNL